MAFKLDDFTTKVRDLSRNYMFESEIMFPTALNLGKDKQALVNILVESTSLPVKSLEEVDASFMGQPIKIAGNLSYPTWNVTLRVNDNYSVYSYFRAWSELVVGTETNIAAFPTDYKSNINLYQLDGAGNRIIAYTLYGAWLSSVGEESLDYGNRGYSTLAVGIEFDYFLQSVYQQ